jgi:hypothetical protein
MTDYVISEEQLCMWENDIDVIEGEFGCSGDPPNKNLSIISHIRSRPLSEELKKERERVLDEISQSLTTCSFYDEMISGEWGCIGNRNGERKCKGCPYFKIDENQLRATIESLRGEP